MTIEARVDTNPIASGAIAYIDDHLIVANKPAGLLSVPGRTADKQDCLLARMKEWFPNLYVVHRLDRDTSGAILLARRPKIQSAFGRMFQTGQIEKEYVAWVEGRPAESSGRIDVPIAREVGSTLPPRYCVDPKLGRPAITLWTVIRERCGQTQLRLIPHTGRSHQLRVHCHHLGHPIVGDPIYGRPRQRMFLHAHRLCFVHPGGDDKLKIEVPVPF